MSDPKNPDECPRCRRARARGARRARARRAERARARPCRARPSPSSPSRRLLRVDARRARGPVGARAAGSARAPGTAGSAGPARCAELRRSDAACRRLPRSGAAGAPPARRSGAPAAGIRCSGPARLRGTGIRHRRPAKPTPSQPHLADRRHHRRARILRRVHPVRRRHPAALHPGRGRRARLPRQEEGARGQGHVAHRHHPGLRRHRHGAAVARALGCVLRRATASTTTTEVASDDRA